MLELTLVTEVLSPQEKLGMGLIVSGVYIRITLGSLLGGFLTENFGWQSIFFMLKFH